MLRSLLEAYDLKKQVVGGVRIFSFDPKSKQLRKLVTNHNDVLFSGADVLAQLLTGHPEYKISTMYLEYKNLPNPLDPITPPVFDRTGGVAYYSGLSGSLDTDFLRIPLTVSPEISAATVDYEGNQINFFGISEGTVGFHGKPFNPGVNSAVFGAALVATPDPDDQSADRVYARMYSGIDKVLKETGFEIGVVWTTRFN
jgi:hypothetical protein